MLNSYFLIFEPGRKSNTIILNSFVKNYEQCLIKVRKYRYQRIMADMK